MSDVRVPNRMSFSELKEFRGIWNVLARKGVCDTFGGLECRRVLRDWMNGGRAAALARFICEVANIHAPQPGDATPEEIREREDQEWSEQNH